MIVAGQEPFGIRILLMIEVISMAIRERGYSPFFDIIF